MLSVKISNRTAEEIVLFIEGRERAYLDDGKDMVIETAKDIEITVAPAIVFKTAGIVRNT